MPWDATGEPHARADGPLPAGAGGSSSEGLSTEGVLGGEGRGVRRDERGVKRGKRMR